MPVTQAQSAPEPNPDFDAIGMGLFLIMRRRTTAAHVVQGIIAGGLLAFFTANLVISPEVHICRASFCGGPNTRFVPAISNVTAPAAVDSTSSENASAHSMRADCPAFSCAMARLCKTSPGDCVAAHAG
jgi:hypothetical protein